MLALLPNKGAFKRKLANTKLKKLFFFVAILGCITTRAQYAPAAGLTSSSAIFKDSSIIVSWADSILLNRGYIAINDSSLGLASVGDENSAKGKALENGVVSLGDGGSATAYFVNGIRNQEGYDFAVFENGFEIPGSQLYHIELAFVEVSTDGIHFYRFPNHSLTQDTLQVGNFEGLKPNLIDGLAGKYIAGYGTPFDLATLTDSIGNNPIHYIRIKDVVGALNDSFCNYDSDGRKINDPWPSVYASSGFDLDAIAVLQNKQTGIAKLDELKFEVYPNPILKETELQMSLPNEHASAIQIFNALGQCLFEANYTAKNIRIPVPCTTDFLMVLCRQDNHVFTTKIIQQ